MVPVLGTAAGRARARAQRSALGSDAGLFEDEAGKPLPWIAAQIGEMPAEPDLEDDLLDALPGSSGLGGTAPTDGSAINGNMLGLFEPIEGTGNPLAHFHRALRALEGGHDADGKVRVLVFGASHTEADIYPQYVRSYLQERFGDGGHGFVMPAQPWRSYSHVDVAVEGFAHWRTDHAQRSDDELGRYGLLGASVTSRDKRAVGKVVQQAGVVAGRYELFYLATPRGGTVDLYADGKPIGSVATAARKVAAGYHAFELPQGEHTIELRIRGDGEVRLFGLTVERDDDGIVVDTLGIKGTRAANALEWDPAIWADNVRRRAPDLFVMAFGTNEATDTQQPIADYEARLHRVVESYRDAAGPASCLLVGPGDFPQVLPDGTVLPRARVGEIVAVQARVAVEHGCGFWDLRAFMGGELAMAQWVRSTPPMASPDYIHLSRRGYVRMGMALVDALMADYDYDDPLHSRSEAP